MHLRLVPLYFLTLLVGPQLSPSSKLTGVSTNGDFVLLDSSTGETKVLGRIVEADGRHVVSDLLVLPGGEQALVSIVEIGDNAARTVLARCELKSGKRLDAWAPLEQAIDGLCPLEPGQALAAAGSSRPQKLVQLDLARQSLRELGVLDPRLFLGSLCLARDGGLYGLHMRTPELDHDALVRLDRKTGALLETIRLDLPTRALALTIDSKGRFLLTADGEWLHELDPKTGRPLRTQKTGAVRIVGL